MFELTPICPAAAALTKRFYNDVALLDEYEEAGKQPACHFFAERETRRLANEVVPAVLRLEERSQDLADRHVTCC